MLTYAITYILPSISWKFVFLHDCTHIYIYPVLALSSYLVFVAIRIGAKWERLQPGAVEQKT